MINGNVNESDGTSTGKNFISNYYTGVVDSILRSDQTFVNEFSTFTFNLNHQYKDTTGRELVTDFDYSINDNDRNTYVPNVYVTPEGEFPLSSTYYRSVTPTTITIFSLKSDYTQKLFKGKLGAGYKVSLVNTDNTFNFFNINGFDETLDPTRSNRFEYQENVYALYLNYQKTFGKFDVQAGVRMETTESEGDLSSEITVDDKNVERSYTDFFPSAGITWNVHKNHAVAAVYSSRIDRPNYGELNPFENKLDELSYRKGNPFLDPQYSNKVELSHTFKYATTTSISYSRTERLLRTNHRHIAGGISYMTPRNLATEEVHQF
jgi:iron complex outermembrane recepter protein